MKRETMYAMCFEVMVQRQWINNPLVPSVTFLRHGKKCRSRSDAAEGRHCLLSIQKVKTLMSEAPFFFFCFFFFLVLFDVVVVHFSFICISTDAYNTNICALAFESYQSGDNSLLTGTSN